MNPEFLASASDPHPIGAIPLTEAIPDEAEVWAGDYLLLRQIGAGGMGEVYQAQQLSTRRVVALKQLRAGRPDARFDQEMQALARLRHPGLVGLLHAGQHQGRPFMVLEYVEGSSLAERLRTGPLPPREAARLLQQAAHALHHAHQAGIVHRDVKPGNLLLDPDGNVRVTDFSVAKDLNLRDGVTLPGEAVGTPAYMAPEQVEPRLGPAGPATDVYGLGATLFHALTGQAPFSGTSTGEILRRLGTAEPQWPREAIHRDLRVITDKSMRKDPGARYRSAEALAEDLGRFLAGEPIRARPPTWRERTMRWARRPWPVALALAVLLGGGIAWQVPRLLNRTRVGALVRDWPHPAPQAAHQLALPTGTVSGLHASFSEDGRLFAVGGHNGNVRIADCTPWHVVGNSLLRSAPIRFHRFLSGRTLLFTADDSGLWRIWRVVPNRMVYVAQREASEITAFAASARTTRWAVGTREGRVTVWEASGRGFQPVFRLTNQTEVVSLQFAARGTRLLVASRREPVRLWELPTDRVVWSWTPTNEVFGAVLSPQQDQVTVGTVLHNQAGQDEDSRLTVFRVTDGAQLGTVTRRLRIRQIQYSPDGGRLLACGDRMEVILLDSRARELGRTGNHAGHVTRAEFSPDGLRLLTVDAAGNARLWDAHDGSPLTDPWRGPHGIAHATFAPDGRHVGSADQGASGTLWDASCPLPRNWDRTSLVKALLKDGRLAALRRAAWLDPGNPEVLRRLAAATRTSAAETWARFEAEFLERRAAKQADTAPPD